MGSTEAGEPGLRARKKQQTRQSIRDAAVRLVAERGLERVTVDEIAEAANISPRTFFNYFRSKEDALAGIDDEEIEGVCAALRARPADEPPLVALSAVVVSRFDQVARRPDLHEARVQLQQAHPQLFGAHAATWRRFEHSLAVVVAQRCGLPVERHPYPITVVAAVMAVARATIIHWQETPEGDSDLHEQLRTALDGLAHGLPLPPPAAPAAPASDVATASRPAPSSRTTTGSRGTPSAPARSLTSTELRTSLEPPAGSQPLTRTEPDRLTPRRASVTVPQGELR
jgi:AcrR family transcriptional regulator